MLCLDRYNGNFWWIQMWIIKLNTLLDNYSFPTSLPSLYLSHFPAAFISSELITSTDLDSTEKKAVEEKAAISTKIFKNFLSEMSTIVLTWNDKTVDSKCCVCVCMCMHKRALACVCGTERLQICNGLLTQLVKALTWLLVVEYLCLPLTLMSSDRSQAAPSAFSAMNGPQRALTSAQPSRRPWKAKWSHGSAHPLQSPMLYTKEENIHQEFPMCQTFQTHSTKFYFD